MLNIGYMGFEINLCGGNFCGQIYYNPEPACWQTGLFRDLQIISKTKDPETSSG